MARILRLILIAVTLYLLIFKTSTIGWRFRVKSFMDTKKENTELVERLKSHVYKLSHEIGDRSIFKLDKLNEAEKYITQTFESFGYSVEFQEYNVSSGTAKNIIVSKVGTKRPQEVIIIGAHYDTCFNLGADDNASAVAGLLELANITRDTETQRSIKFIAFVNEEPPFFKTEDMGSLVYARNARKRGEDIKAAIILEMIGYYSDKPHSQQYPPIFGFFYPNKGNFIGVVGNFPSRGLVKEVVTSFGKKTPFPVESIIAPVNVAGVDFSDNWSFWKEGYPAVMITDTGFYRNPNYHTEQDTYETLDYESLAEVVKGFSGVLRDLAK